jgi:hypothetical protein
MLNFIIQNKEVIGIIISFFAIVVPLFIFLINKKKQKKQINFNRFHKDLIKGLSNQDGRVGLDQQVAIIFELRNFPEYYPASRRILVEFNNNWKKRQESEPKLKRLIAEAEKTMNYMNKNFIEKFFIRIFNRP